MEAIETIASQWLEEHPEYHSDFADEDAALEKMYDVEAGKTNPFLHLSMHETMDCLGQMVWESQRAGRPPDGAAYIDCVQRNATRD